MRMGALWLGMCAYRRLVRPITRVRWCGAVGCGVVRGGEGKGEKEEGR
jgi:hypothetical protein